MEQSEKMMFESIFSALERFLEKTQGLNIFENLNFTYKIRVKSNKRSSRKSPKEGMITFTEEFLNEVQNLLLTYKGTNIESKGVKLEANEDLQKEPIFLDIDSDIEIDNLDNSIDKFSNSSNVSHQYRTRRQRMLREAQENENNHQQNFVKEVHPKENLPGSIASKSNRKKKSTHFEWQCELCSRIFEDALFLETHKRIVHDSSSADLASTQEKLSDESILDRDSSNLLCCCQCFLTFKDMTKFENHICNLVEEELNELEGPIKTGRDRLMQHWDMLKNLNLLICDQCCEQYKSLRRMTYHLWKCTPGPYLCEICKKPYESKKDLNYHKKQTHKDTLSFFCSECDARYKNRPSLQKHMVFKHEGTKEGFDCDECEEVFEKKILLTKHKEKKHQLIKKFLCQICGEGLSNQQSLKIHVQTHMSAKKFHCDFCDASFHRKDKLVFHRRTHTGEKPFECDECNKKFIRKSKLKEHKERHLGLRTNVCDMCPKTFYGAYDLKMHRMKKHSLEKSGEGVPKIKKTKIDVIEEEEEDPDSTTEDDPLSFKFESVSGVAAENSQVGSSDSIDNLPLGAIGNFINPEAPLPQDSVLPSSVLQVPVSLPPQTSLQPQPTHYFHIPQALQIQVPVAVAGTTLDLSQVSTQPIILTNFDFNSMNNLQF